MRLVDRLITESSFFIIINQSQTNTASVFRNFFNQWGKDQNLCNSWAYCLEFDIISKEFRVLWNSY